ncbi:MAG: cation transporter [Candidatus Portnoybacteria bacterium]|nr:cation transporter [Candidatus Portnoybacteria bacterium]
MGAKHHNHDNCHHDSCVHCHDYEYLRQLDKRRLLAALIINFMMMAVELISGLMAGSISLFSDGVHMLADGSGLSCAFYAITIAHKKPTAEPRAAQINGCILLVMAVYIFVNVRHRLLYPMDINVEVMTGIAIAGFIANIIMYFILHDGNRHSLVMRSATWHVLCDTLSSAGVITGGIVIYFSGWRLIDPILGFVIGALVLNYARKLIIESNILLHDLKRNKNHE